jgi:hypothetical protein
LQRELVNLVLNSMLIHTHTHHDRGRGGGLLALIHLRNSLPAGDLPHCRPLLTMRTCASHCVIDKKLTFATPQVLIGLLTVLHKMVSYICTGNRGKTSKWDPKSLGLAAWGRPPDADGSDPCAKAAARDTVMRGYSGVSASSWSVSSLSDPFPPPG